MTCCGNSDINKNDIVTPNDFHDKYSNLKHTDKVYMIVKI